MSAVHSDYDVAIAGYGPTGLAAASMLARAGHRVCVFERWPSLYGQPRIATIDGESARIIQAACDIDLALRNSGPRREYLQANEAGEVLISHKWDRDHVCGFPSRITLHQPDIEDAMDAAAREAGAEINQGCEVTGLEQDADFVSVSARRRVVSETGEASLGETRTVSARYLIGADGARSAVRQLLGVELERWDFRGAWLCIDARRKRTLPNIRGLSPDAQTAVIFCTPMGRAHAVISLGHDYVRFNRQVDPDEDLSGELTEAAAFRFLGETYGLTEDDVTVTRLAVYPFEGGLARTFRVGRVVLAGDAAHIMPPFYGQGGCSAFRDAIGLAWRFDLMLRGVAGPSLLDTYELERRPDVRAHIERSVDLAKVVFVDDPDAAAARDELYLSGKAALPNSHPALVDGVLHRAAGGRVTPPVGTLGPQGRVRVGACEGRFDDVVGRGFQLIWRGGDPTPHLSIEAREFLASAGGVTVGLGKSSDGLVEDIDGAYNRFLDDCDADGLLMRPDFIVFGVAREPGELSPLVMELARQIADSWERA